MLKVRHLRTQNQISIVKPLTNEHGIALIIAISLLAIMSILGAILMSTSSNEIQSSGSNRNKMESFYTADRAFEYAMHRAASTSALVDLYNDEASPGVLHKDLIDSGNSGLEPSNADLSNADPEQWDDRNSTLYIGSTPPPVGSGSDATVFIARNYRITTVGISPLSATSPARTQMRGQIVKIVPK